VSGRHNIHATGLVLGSTGVMLRGPSGSGKSLLALELMDEWESRGLQSWLIADDRLNIEVSDGALIMHAPASIEGLIELRGRGIVSRPFLRQARIDLVVDLVPEFERMVEEDHLQIDLHGILITRCPVPRAGLIDSRHQLLLVREALRSLSALPQKRQKTA
jgi:serine kinase of HPr protein (carbohydrate metabolism regulator)